MHEQEPIRRAIAVADMIQDHVAWGNSEPICVQSRERSMTTLVEADLEAESLQLSEFEDRLSIYTTRSAQVRDTFAEDVRAGLTATPKSLPCKHLYDTTGAQLFEEICSLPEYYPTRTEKHILDTRADDIVASLGKIEAMTELGAGSAAKTGGLLERLLSRHDPFVYNPIDISREMIRMCAERLLQQHENLTVLGMICDYETGLKSLPKFVPQRKVFVFLGSSMGNSTDQENVAFLKTVASAMSPQDSVLVGVDMAKDPDVVHAAYNDAAGVTAAFNKNILTRINRVLGGRFDPDRFAHRAEYHPERGRVEIFLESLQDQSVPIRDLNLTVSFARGGRVHTEYSHKYTPEAFQEIAQGGAMRVERFWTDDRQWFRLVQLRRAE